MFRQISFLFICLSFVSCATCNKGKSPKVYFVSPKDGDVVTNPVKVQMGLSGYVIRPAGVVYPESGHHHLIIDGEAIPKGIVVPADDKHLHFGKGQTETEVTLKPGKHKLRLQFADALHQSYGPEMSDEIEITVK